MTDEEKFDIDLSQLEIKDQPKSEEKKELEKPSIPPDLVIILFDGFFSRTICAVGGLAGYDIPVKDIKLTPVEIKTLRPYVEASLNKFLEWLQNKAPEHFMLLMIIVITYGSKVMVAAKKKTKKAQAKASEQGEEKPKSTLKRPRKTSKIK